MLTPGLGSSRSFLSHNPCCWCLLAMDPLQKVQVIKMEKRQLLPPITRPFRMTLEEFPALPPCTNPSAAGAQSTTPPSPSIQLPINNIDGRRVFPCSSETVYDASEEMNFLRLDSTPYKQSIIAGPEGRFSNIPTSMLSDQFGMVGLISFLKTAQLDTDLAALAVGTDLTGLGLNLNAHHELHPTFGGPLSSGIASAEDMEHPVPPEYHVSEQIKGPNSVREKLLGVNVTKFNDDLLFYLFYKFPGDILQVQAAGELYNRDWRYHKEEKVWITRMPCFQNLEKGDNYEKGTYLFFDSKSWKKVAKMFYLEYDKLECRPAIPPYNFSQTTMPR